MFGAKRLDTESRCFFLNEDARLHEAAALLSFVRGGANLDATIGARTIESLADIALWYGVDPDAMQAALIKQEPILGTNEGLLFDGTA